MRFIKNNIQAQGPIKVSQMQTFAQFIDSIGGKSEINLPANYFSHSKMIAGIKRENSKKILGFLQGTSALVDKIRAVKLCAQEGYFEPLEKFNKQLVLHPRLRSAVEHALKQKDGAQIRSPKPSFVSISG